MNIACIGGGPAGLYFALLMKQADPSHDITVYERNQADDTFGWGVVFSQETLGHFEKADAQSFAAIRRSFRYWDNIDTFYQDHLITSTGHGFCGLSRKALLNILQGRCLEVGVKLHFTTEVSAAALPDADLADLIVACDGANSAVRERFRDHFQPTIEWGRCKFAWLGTTLPLSAFTFIYRENEHGLFQVHAYPFEKDPDGTRELSTFIVECREEVWRRAGLDRASEEQTVAYCQHLFAKELGGHALLSNRSIWRTFPAISNRRWHHDNIVLLGDAAHTAHFSVGSGTKLAMEDSIALAQVFSERGGDDIPAALQAYEERRRVDVLKVQKAAGTSQAWFEHSARYLGQHPLEFTFNQLTRSMRITWDNLERRDAPFVQRVRQHYADRHAAKQHHPPVPMFTPFHLRELRLQNRVAVAPMCMYSAEDGTVNDFHLVHLGSRAMGGAGLVFTEMTDVTRDGRISPGCAGMYKAEHVAAWRRVVDFVHQHSQAKIAVQLGHAGRKGSTRLSWEGDSEPLPQDNWPLISASPIPYQPHNQVPREMDRGDMHQLRDAFVRATGMAVAAGFDMLELHMAHGYLLASFLSPLTNRRGDEYGGAVAARMRFPLEVFDAVRAAWPAGRPMSVRISACDWAPGGITQQDAVAAARLLKAHGCDIVSVSTGQTVAEARPVYGRMYQVPFSDLIRHEARVPTITVGNLLGGDHCNTILAAGRADLCAMARLHLRDPYLALHEGERYDHAEQPWPPQYRAGRGLRPA